LPEAQCGNQLSRIKADATLEVTIFEHGNVEYLPDSTVLISGTFRKPALGDHVGADNSTDQKRCLARRKGLMTPISFKISTTKNDLEKGGYEVLAFFEFLHNARCPAEGPLPRPLRP
jgi:hypothetical protein